MDESRNVLGGKLETCSREPLTGFYRDGCCNTGPEDLGAHLVCTRVTDEFLKYSRENGNDLSTPHPEWGFPGLTDGDRWCVCAARWKEACDAGFAAPVYLAATHEAVLEIVETVSLDGFELTPTGSPVYLREINEYLQGGMLTLGAAAVLGVRSKRPGRVHGNEHRHVPPRRARGGHGHCLPAG